MVPTLPCLFNSAACLYLAGSHLSEHPLQTASQACRLPLAVRSLLSCWWSLAERCPRGCRTPFCRLPPAAILLVLPSCCCGECGQSPSSMTYCIVALYQDYQLVPNFCCLDSKILTAAWDSFAALENTRLYTSQPLGQSPSYIEIGRQQLAALWRIPLPESHHHNGPLLITQHDGCCLQDGWCLSTARWTFENDSTKF